MAGITATFGFPYASQFLMNGHHTRCDSTTAQLTPHSPHTAPRVCSCQLEQVLQAQQKMNTLPLGFLPRATPNFPAEPNIIFGARDPGAVAYSPMMRHCDVKDINTGALNSAWFVNPTRYDHQNFERGAYLACHAYGDRFSPIDLNSGARRKNATRETTSTLKAWLYEHRKNPYPTKGEKIMLAILTKMTLTQVSTWFANARRRLKKENKMTWSPRNRCGERKDSEGYSDDEDDDDDMESKADDVNCEEKSPFRMTTVIKSPEDTTNIRHANFASTSPISSTAEKLSRDAEPPSRETPHPNPAEQRIIWPTGRSPVETENSRIQHTSSIEDSPVKSLRKWVDGCFDNTRSPTQAPDTPPQTPPCETDRILSERVSQSMEQDRRETRRKSPSSSPCPPKKEKCFIDKTQDRSQEAKNDNTSNREIDAALALTTLFGTRR